MAEAELAQNADAPSRRSAGGFLRRKLPFIGVLALAVFGVAYQNISSRPLVGYWEFLSLATGVLCVVTAWDNSREQKRSLSADWDASGPLGGYPPHDEYAALVGSAANVARTGDEPRSFDIVCARHFSSRGESHVLGDLFFGPCNGARRAGNCVVQAVRTLFTVRRCVCDGTSVELLAATSVQGASDVALLAKSEVSVPSPNCRSRDAR